MPVMNRTWGYWSEGTELMPFELTVISNYNSDEMTCTLQTCPIMVKLYSFYTWEKGAIGSRGSNFYNSKFNLTYISAIKNKLKKEIYFSNCLSNK